MLVENIMIDCDDTAGLTEALAFIACCGVVNETLADRGVQRTFTPESLKAGFVGQTFRRIVQSLGEEHGFAVTEADLDALALKELNAVCAIFEKEGVQACAGIEGALDYVQGRYELSVVSSSHIKRVRLALRMAGLQPFVRRDRVFSATSSLSTPQSKPSPAIYLHALKVTGAAPERTLAVEDSTSGVLAGVRAGIPVVGYVGSHPVCKQGAGAQKLKDAGAQWVVYHWDEFLPLLRELENRND